MYSLNQVGVECRHNIDLQWNEVANDLAITIVNDGDNSGENYGNDDIEMSEGGHGNINIKEGHVFEDRKSMINAMNMWSIRSNYQHKVKRASNRDYVLICLDDRCNWYFRSSKLRKTNLYKVRKFNPNHTCSLNKLFDNWGDDGL